MILFALISVVCGIALGSSLKVFVLVPASCVVWIIGLAFGWVEGLSLLQSLPVMVLGAACLQLSYLASATMVTDFRTVPARSKAHLP
jgi:hypothetical protein